MFYFKAIWLLVMGWLLLLGSNIWHFGTQDHAARADCIIVLGAAIHGSEPSPVFAERIRHAVNLYHHGFAAKIVFTGGIGEGSQYSESSVGSTFAQQWGVPSADIITEENSHTTQQNLQEAAILMTQHRLKSAIIVSDPLHLKRAMMMANDQGMTAVSLPTPTTMYRSLATQLPFLVREMYFIHHYALTNLS